MVVDAPVFAGIDLAWGRRARTGIAVVDAAGRLVASVSVSKAVSCVRGVGPDTMPSEKVVAPCVAWIWNADASRNPTYAPRIAVRASAAVAKVSLDLNSTLPSPSRICA